MSNTAMISPVEQELNEIRIRHYEQTKNMTNSERTAYYKAKAERALKSYGIKVVPVQSARRAD
jgi:hypothetical protein